MIPDWISPSQLLLSVLLHFVWQATLIVTAVIILRCLIGPKYFQTRYAVSVLALIAIVLAPVATAGYCVVNFEATSLDLAITSQAAPVSFATPDILGTLESGYQLIFEWFDSNRVLWLGVWTFGLVIFMSRLVISYCYCLTIRRSKLPLPRHLDRIANRIIRKLNISSKVVVASSRNVTQAIATGIIKPVVLIPTSWITQLPVPALEAVIAHELAHIRRWDLWINAIQRIVESLFFFHPLVWWLSQTTTNDREICCDQLAIRVTGQPVRYVEALTEVAASNSINNTKFQFGTTFTGGRKMSLLHRAQIILEPRALESRTSFRLFSMIACIGLLVSIGSYAYCATGIPTPKKQGTEVDVVVVGPQDDHQERHSVEDIFVFQDGKQDEKKDDHKAQLHAHLIDLLHGQKATASREHAEKIHEHLLELIKKEPDSNLRLKIQSSLEQGKQDKQKPGTTVDYALSRIAPADPRADAKSALRWIVEEREHAEHPQDHTNRFSKQDSDAKSANQKIHEHLVELLHNEENDVDRSKIANKLRAIADQLDSVGSSHELERKKNIQKKRVKLAPDVQEDKDIEFDNRKSGEYRFRRNSGDKGTIHLRNKSGDRIAVIDLDNNQAGDRVELDLTDATEDKKPHTIWYVKPEKKPEVPQERRFKFDVQVDPDNIERRFQKRSTGDDVNQEIESLRKEINALRRELHKLHPDSPNSKKFVTRLPGAKLPGAKKPASYYKFDIQKEDSNATKPRWRYELKRNDDDTDEAVNQQPSKNYFWMNRDSNSEEDNEEASVSRNEFVDILGRIDLHPLETSDGSFDVELLVEDKADNSKNTFVDSEKESSDK